MQNLKVALCSINSKYIHSSLSTWYLAAGIEEYCKKYIVAEVVEGTINEDPDNIARRIISLNPRVIGFSCYIWNITVIKKLVRLIRAELPEAIIVLGGPEVSYNAEEILSSQPMVDYIISGEGEAPFALLLNSILQGEVNENIPGLCYRDHNEIITASPYISGGEPISPYTERYLNTLNGRIAYLETSRGCPYSCAFCLSGRCGGVRYFDLERAKKEIIKLGNSRAKTVKFVDRTFNANIKRAKELFGFIIENYGAAIPVGVCFHFEIAGDIIDEETLFLLSKARAGAMQFEIGLQSFNVKTLDAINRKTDIDRLKFNINRLIENENIHIHIDLISGLPYEDMYTFEKGFNIAYALKPNMLQMGFLKLLHGARMREMPEEYPCKFSSNPPYEVTETPWLSRDALIVLHYTEDALDRLYNSGRFRRTLEYVLKQGDMTPFELFSRVGEFSASKDLTNISLDNYIELVYSYFIRQSGIDKVVLRDLLACDFISTNSSGRLPSFLKIYDVGYKKALKKLDENEKTRRLKGIKRGAALLYSENSIAYVDYCNKNPVTGEYPLKKVLLD